jgi:hypothetical protein
MRRTQIKLLMGKYGFVAGKIEIMPTYEGEHTIFGLLGQANLTQNDVLQNHPFTSE